MPNAQTQHPPRAMSNPVVPSARSYSDPTSKTTPPARTVWRTPSDYSTPGLRFRPDSPTSLCFMMHLFVIGFYPYAFPTASLIPLATSAVFVWVVFLWPYIPTHITSPYNKHLSAGNYIAASFLLGLTYGLGLLLPWLRGDEKIAREDRGWPALPWYSLDAVGQGAFAVRMWWDIYQGWGVAKEPKEKADE
ncbi:uncharacterized protein BDZ99DRAFT_460813 [Mytilinidion resinicola]|uniref:Uncharacterized protein n=1 Tax=Mytilinidion resinicola TaxID=574789 RepID=A0A6A6YYR1_9PEZI|nr:uncharacterized protein BDZ99DRAFT_460813 [Mytilinidion resinicola]KAF2813639.1 hypothetical protein BDZ99DRAFT_460813 [Mytilinidion resinicola]